MKKESKIARLLFYTGLVLIFIGLVITFFQFDNLLELFDNYGEDLVDGLQISYMLQFLAGGFQTIIFGVLLIGLAEVIELLHHIKVKTIDVENSQEKSIQPFVNEEKQETLIVMNDEEPIDVKKEKKPYDPNAVPLEIRNKIREFYSKEGRSPVRFYKTPFNNIVFIELDNFEHRAVIIDPFGVNEELPQKAWGEELKKWLAEEGFMI